MFPLKQNKPSTYLWVGRKRYRLKKEKYLQDMSGDCFCIWSACLEEEKKDKDLWFKKNILREGDREKKYCMVRTIIE